MSLENARLAYPLLIRLARELSQAARERRPVSWITYDDLCQRCRGELSLNETPRSIVPKLLRPLQSACLEHERPDLSALVIQKPKGRSDTGHLLRPSDSWWEPYVERGEATVGDVDFWFVRFRQARDYGDWPETPFF
jgi:hypothetical protein